MEKQNLGSSSTIAMTLKWKNVSLINSLDNRLILNDLSGSVSSGEFLTIMGPSGAGKSSFLSIITKKKENFSNKLISKGTTFLNKKKYSTEDFSKISSFVQQDDILLQTLTIRCINSSQHYRNLSFSSKTQTFQIFLDIDIRQGQQLAKIIKFILGGKLIKSISGGQKKRVAIGLQLISDPPCIILDQPTSGLDSFNSLKILNILVKLAKQQKKIIIATIHQPSSIMFQNFDKLFILKNGEQIFFDKANLLISYMENIGIEIDYTMNPSDFFMLQISAYKQLNKKYKTKMTAQNFRKYQIQNIKEVVENQQINNNNFQLNSERKTKSYKGEKIPILHQFKPLLIRSFKNFFRTPSIQRGKILMMILFPFQLGVLFFDIIETIPPLEETQKMAQFLLNFSAFIFLGLFFSLGKMIFDTILIFPSQRELIMKEINSNMYSLNVYYLSKLVVQIPGHLIPVLTSTTILYFVLNLEQDLQHYLFFVGIYLLQGFAGYMMGLIIGVLCKSEQFAVQIVPLILIPMVLFGGLAINLNSIPEYAGWIQYINPIRYGYNALLNSQLKTESLQNLSKNQIVRQLIGISGNQWSNLTSLILMCYSLFIIAFFALYIRKKL